MSARLESNVDDLKRVLEEVADRYSPAAFSSSLSAEDMVITHAILTSNLNIEIFTIDTGRLHGDTLQLLDAIRRRYRYHVRVFTPDAGEVADYIAGHGRDAFFSSTELRRECCRIRKVEPLKRALQGKKAWITGLRQEDTAGRGTVPQRESDESYRLLKVNPLAAWSEGDVWEYLRAYSVPYNELYDQGYRSIGCAPCTRPVTIGENIRAGRWWWEQGAGKECGLHIRPDGTLVRAREAA